ncbi:MAG: addiction module protein [Saprospiraceae bacterium]|nr:addiction module protein [Saprospiraceae bacterium]
MTIEMLKAETTRLTRLERLEFLQFIAALLASEEGVEPLPESQKKTLLRRRDEVKNGKVATVSAKTVKANLIRKYGLQA